ncbi:sigma-54-dependent Fis family transcriptional regulator [Pseudonocardia acidicola]|uniref:Sigma 54-interacting transcriptional regulator n=1 Tax=Pseudonocardia acidicola TaxID=2724939 RepID=A0ABX1S4W5_9PSEU|nr:helix-turn-helix domain-containing protein [Pseudonocardia acidicola]NMH95942.1 sigma 54-interacting transcriptional regulator [Pseudonocardia acidicola]
MRWSSVPLARQELSTVRALRPVDHGTAWTRHARGTAARESPRPSRLLRAAGPVLDRLAAELDGQPVVMLLADPGARVLARVAGRPELEAWLDELRVRPGTCLDEEEAGTNAIGRALEERRPVVVSGREHTRQRLHGFSCCAVPVRNAVTGVVRGVLGIGCRADEPSGLLRPLVSEAVRRIESRLSTGTAHHERLLLERFLQATRRSPVAVVSLNRDVLMSNTMAATLVGPSDQALLWEWASGRLVGRTEYTGELRLSGGVVVRARCSRVGGDEQTGILIEMRPAAGGLVAAVRSTDDAGGGTVGLPGRSGAADRIRREVATAAGARLPVLLTGAPGVGKLFVARHLHERTRAGQRFSVLPPGDGAGWAARFAEALRTCGTVVLRHADELPDELLTDVVDAVERLGQDPGAHPVTLVATVRAGGADRPATDRLRAWFPVRLHLPPLRRRADDVPDIAAVIIREHARYPSPPRLRSATVQNLMRQEWPGNVRELRAVLTGALMRSMGSDIGIEHLPPEYREAPIAARLTPMQRAEREALLDALDDSDGNKQAAAERLGIARSTLYRKLRILGIDGRCLSG